MSKLEIFEVKSRHQLEKFVKFPMELYKNNKNYVPPLLKNEMEIWNEDENPALHYSFTKKLLAYKNGKVVGRIALIINKKEAAELGIKKVRFGWFDFIDDEEVSKALINEAIQFAKEYDLKKIEGPMGFTNLDFAGMLTKGFDRLATMIGLYNAPYYPEHLEKLGLVAEKEWVEYELNFPEIIPDKIYKFNELIKQKYGLKVLKFATKDELLPYVEPMFKLLDETYKHLSSYTPITKEQITTYKEKYFNFINKDYVVCIANERNELVSFAITMPSYSVALQKAKGKLFPFGWWHFLQAGRKNDRANFYLIGIHPEFQKRGITSIIFKEIHETFKSKGIKYLETNPELIENKDIQLLWQDYNPVNHKRRKTFSLEIK